MTTDTLWTQVARHRWGRGPAGRIAGLIYLALAVALGVFQLYTAMYLVMDAFLLRVFHLMFVLLIACFTVPAARTAWARGPAFVAVDAVLMAAAVVISLYLYVNYHDLTLRIGRPTPTDIAMGVVAILLVLEATRRVVGNGMTLIVLAFLLYAYFGRHMPGLLNHRGFSFERIVYHTYQFQEGIYGLPLGVAATFVFMFIFFGALLEKTGAGQFFIDLAYTATGRYRGGPAKAGVVASAFMGSISGSAIANAVTTGAFTIPMMKRVGYKAHEAAGVEAAASTGGQVLPPIMGAGAFIMAELLGIPYTDIAKVSIIPALMYFVTVFLFVDILARRHGIEGMRREEIPRIGPTLAAGFHYLVPMAVLIVLLARYYTPMRAGLYAMGVLAVVSMLRAHSRLTWRSALETFALAARNTLTVSVATAAAGIIVGVVGLTGLGLKFSRLMLAFSGDSLVLALVLVAVASLVLGLGLPVTASYIVLVILAGPALTHLGLTLLTAHMIVYWYSQDSNVTPPVALAAFAAAGIAGANPMRAGLSAWKFAKGLYIIPLLMAYSPLLLDGTAAEVALAVASGTLGLLSFAVAIEGFLFRKTTVLERLLMLGATVGLLTPYQALDYVGMALVALVVLMQVRTARPPASAPARA